MSMATRNASRAAAANANQNENTRFTAKSHQGTLGAGVRRPGAALTDITNISTQASRAPQHTTRSSARAQAMPTSQPIMSEDAMMVDEPIEQVSQQTFEASYMEVERTWTDIDEMDHQDPQAVTTYVEDIYENCRLKERQLCVTENYMPKQAEINEKMRYILMDWLVEVHLKFKLLPETMSLAVNLVDRFLSKHSAGRENLQLVGITCMFLAAKYEEIYPPECNDFVYISASAYTRDQILAMEGTILNAVEFKLTVPTSLHFLRRFSKAAGSDYSTHTLCKYLLELALVDMRMNKYYPSVTAAAAVYLARVMTSGNPDWNTTLQHYTQYEESYIHSVAKDLLNVLRDAQSSNHQAVVRKYQSRKFGEVARRPIPASLDSF